MNKIIFLLLFPSFLLGQTKHDYIWMLGSQGDPNNQHPQHGLDILDFNDNELTVTKEYWQGNFFVTAASIEVI